MGSYSLVKGDTSHTLSVYLITHEALPAQIVSALISISALELVKCSVAMRLLAPICLLLGVEMVALIFLFPFGAGPVSHSDFFFFRVLLGTLRPNCSLAVSVSSPSSQESSSTQLPPVLTAETSLFDGVKVFLCSLIID